MSDFSIVAVRDAVIFKAVDREDEVTSAGIIMPADSINKNDHHGIRGEVLAVGPDVKLFKPGCHILVNKFDAVPFPHKTEVLHFTKAEFIRGKYIK